MSEGFTGKRRAAAASLLLVTLLACSSGRGAAPAAAGPLRAVLISFDGVGGLRLNELLARGKLRAGGFAAFARSGILAGRAIDVTPSLTPSAHISAITGAPPSRTGIVGHYFHEPGAPFGRSTDGFAAGIETETLWEAAIRQGKRVGVVLYPGADGKSERRKGAFGVIWPEHPLQKSSFQSLGPERWADASVSAPEGTRTFSPAREARLTVQTPGKGAMRLRLVALDTSNDGRVDYDLVRIEREDAGRGVLASARRNGWFRLEASGAEGNLTAWCRIMEVDPDLKRVVLYVGAFYPLVAYPEDYRRRLEAEVGGWPGPTDYAFFRAGHGPEDEDAYEEQAMRLAEYMTKILVFTIRTERWDLLIGYEPLVDEMEHAFEPGPAGGSRDRVERAFEAADRSVAAILAQLRPSDSVFVHSDHGMVPLTKAVNIQKFLEQRGWTIAREGAAPPAGGRRVQVEASSGIAHLYVDPALPSADREAAVEALRKDVQGLEQPGEPLIDEIFRRSDLARVALDNPRSGDVVVLLRPGAEFSTFGKDIVGPPRERGGHGYRNATPELDACFMAMGPGIRRSRPAVVSLLDVAPSVARALGIGPPGK
jgi:predicted AlkP superfamily pyrophosphatase or phosphodiesterase